MPFPFLQNFPLRSVLIPKSRGVAEFLLLRGSIVGTWAGLESLLDQANHVAFKFGNRALGLEIPISFKRKVAYLRKACRTVDVMKVHAIDAIAFVEELVSLMEDRHYLVHGYFVPKESTHKDWVIYRHEFSKDELRTLKRTFTSKELDVLFHKLIDLVDQGTDYANALTRDVAQYVPNDDER